MGTPRNELNKTLPEYLGTWGRYQCRLLLLSLFPSIMMGLQILVFSFSAAQPNTRCWIKGIDDEAGSTYSSAFALGKESIYFGVDSGSVEICKYCPNATAGKQCIKQEQIDCDQGYVYDYSQYASSLAIKFDMACSGAWKRSFISSMFMFGFLVSSLCVGFFSDRFGRRPVVIISALIQIISFNLYPFVPTFEALCVLVFFNGGIQFAPYMPAFTVAQEAVKELPRTICGVLVSAVFASAFIYVGAVAYLIRDWKWLHLCCSGPAVLYVLYYWFMPESIRWLIVNDRQQEANTEFTRALQINRIYKPTTETDDAIKAFYKASTGHNKKKVPALDLFKHWVLAKMAIIMFFSWTIVALVYFGISLNIKSLSGNGYLTFILSGLTEMPGYFVIILLFHYLGRKPAMVIAFTMSGLCCIGKELVPTTYSVIITTLALAGKNAAGSAFAGVWIYSAELFPTVVRNTFIGIGSFFARVGAIIAPQLFFWSKKIDPLLPYIICGALSLISAVSMLFLPETKNVDMPATIHAGVLFAKGKNCDDVLVPEREMLVVEEARIL